MFYAHCSSTHGEGGRTGPSVTTGLSGSNEGGITIGGSVGGAGLKNQRVLKSYRYTLYYACM